MNYFEPLNEDKLEEAYSNVVSPDMISGAVQGIGQIAGAFKSDPTVALKRAELKAKKKACGKKPFIRIGRKAKEKARKVEECLRDTQEQERKMQEELTKRALDLERSKVETQRAALEYSARKSEAEKKRWYETSGGIAGIVIGGLFIFSTVGFEIYKKMS